jgi:putative FmdB family regulatory protein
VPYYDYVCIECGETQEINHSIYDSPNIKCTKCGRECKINIGSNLSHVKFKGVGWYITDYGKMKDT